MEQTACLEPTTITPPDLRCLSATGTLVLPGPIKKGKGRNKTRKVRRGAAASERRAAFQNDEPVPPGPGKAQEESEPFFPLAMNTEQYRAAVGEFHGGSATLELRKIVSRSHRGR